MLPFSVPLDGLDNNFHAHEHGLASPSSEGGEHLALHDYSTEWQPGIGFQVRVTHPHRPYIEIQVVPEDTIHTVKLKANVRREDALDVKFANRIWPDDTLLRDVKVTGGLTIKPGETLHLIAQSRDTYHAEAARFVFFGTCALRFR
jgi:hypothetical protein